MTNFFNPVEWQANLVTKCARNCGSTFIPFREKIIKRGINFHQQGYKSQRCWGNTTHLFLSLLCKYFKAFTLHCGKTRLIHIKNTMRWLVCFRPHVFHKVNKFRDTYFIETLCWSKRSSFWTSQCQFWMTFSSRRTLCFFSILNYFYTLLIGGVYWWVLKKK